MTADLAPIRKMLLVVSRISSRVLGERCGVRLHVGTTPTYAVQNLLLRLWHFA
jgi:hypothetical protein